MSNQNLTLALKIKADLQNAINELDRMGFAMDGTRQSADKLNRTNQVTSNGFNAIAASVKAATLTVAAGFGLNEIIQSADAWTAYQNRLRLVTDTQFELQQASQNVYEIARLTSQQLDSTASVYQRFAQNAEHLNITQEQSAELTETVSKAIAISGGSAASAEAALAQFGQALASGVLRGEEFNSVSEQAPGLLMAIADGLDVDIGKLREMAKEGELTADVLVEALERAKDSVDEQFDTRVETISQAATQFDAAFTRLIGVMSTGQGAGEGLSSVIANLADLLDTMADNAEILGAAIDVALVLAAGRALVAITGLTSAKIKYILTQRAQVVAELNAAKAQALSTERQLASARAGGTAAAATAAHSAAVQRLATAQVAATASNTAFTRSLVALAAVGGRVVTMLSGPLGILLSLGLVATAFIDFGSSAEIGMGIAADATEKASVRVRNAARDMVNALNLGDLKTVDFDQLSLGIEQLEQQLLEAEKVRDRAQTLEDQDIVFGVEGLPSLDEANEKVRSLESAIGRLKKAQSDGRFDGVRAGDKYLEQLAKQQDRLENVTETEKALSFLKKQGISVTSEMGKQILAEAKATEQLVQKKRDEQEAERKAQTEKDEAQRKIKSRIKDQKNYVLQLERTVETQNLSKSELREYELAEKGLTGTLLERARAANAAITTQEKLNQAIKDANTLEGIQIQLLRSNGQGVEARSKELEKQFGDLLKRLKDPENGDADGAALIERLIDVELARTKLDEIQAEIDAALSNQNLAEQTIQTELDAGLIDELDARQRLIEIHRETADILERQRPLLEELSQQPGAVGEAAAAAYKQLNNQVRELRSTSSLLESSLKNGLSGGIQTAIRGLADGTLTLREAVSSLVSSVASAITELLAKLIAQRAVLALFGDSAGGGLFGFSEGGWTGPGAKYDVAGVVHAGEYVQPMARMQEPGALQFMEAFRAQGMQVLNNFRGYADGGSVGNGQLIPAPAAGVGDNPMTVQVVNTLDRDEMAQSLLSTSTASRQIKNIFKAEKSSFRAIMES